MLKSFLTAVLLSASVKRCFVTRMRDFLVQIAWIVLDFGEMWLPMLQNVFFGLLSIVLLEWMSRDVGNSFWSSKWFWMSARISMIIIIWGIYKILFISRFSCTGSYKINWYRVTYGWIQTFWGIFFLLMFGHLSSGRGRGAGSMSELVEALLCLNDKEDRGWDNRSQNI